MSRMTGKEMKLYIGTAAMTSTGAGGITAAGFQLCPTVADVKLNRGSKEADITARGDEFELTKSTVKQVSVDFDMKYDPEDDQMVAVEDAYHSKELIAVAVLDGLIATSGSRGVAANWSVIKADRDEPMDGATVLSVTLKPAEFATKVVIGS